MTVEEREPMLGVVVDGSASSRPALVPLEVVPQGAQAHHAPDLVGLGREDAHALVGAAGMHLSVSVWVTAIGPWGLVLDQQPQPGTRVRRGGRLHVVVSGRPYTPVPDVVGLPLDEAIDQLCWLGFVPLSVSRRASAAVPAGHIVATRPMAGTVATDGSVVGLTVGASSAARVAPADERGR